MFKGSFCCSKYDVAAGTDWCVLQAHRFTGPLACIDISGAGHEWLSVEPLSFELILMIINSSCDEY
jgi:hypothetical protein